jgi:hypothetical protein
MGEIDMTRQQYEKAIKFIESSLDGATYALRVVLRNGQVMQGFPRAHDETMLPMDGAGGGPLVVALAEIVAIEQVPP